MVPMQWSRRSIKKMPLKFFPIQSVDNDFEADTSYGGTVIASVNLEKVTYGLVLLGLNISQFTIW